MHFVQRGLAAGGVLASGTPYRYFESSVPVPTFAKPRPTAKPPLLAVIVGQRSDYFSSNKLKNK